MNNNIKSMLTKKILFGGKISTKNGFTMFERLPLEEIEKLDDSEIAYATGSMGRAIFQITPDNKIKNIKGVDSHLENDEIYMKQLVNANAVYIPNEGKTYSESTFPVNMIIFPGDGHADLRWRGASPLDDLEEEAEVNAKMQGTGVKLPQIVSIRKFDNDFAKSVGLPTGERFGQTERIIENPFRVSDLEYFTKIGDVDAINDIVFFTENLRIKSFMKGETSFNVSFENSFAKQMGKNVASLMNSGWSYKELLHRQDFTLSAEMCDDMYFYLPEKLERSQNPKYKSLYFLQLFTLGSTIKVLQDEMKLRGKSEYEIESVADEYINSFTENIDFLKMGRTLSRDAKLLKDLYIDEIEKTDSFVERIISESGYNPKEEIAQVNEGNEAFYKMLGGKVVDKVKTLDVRKGYASKCVNEISDFVSASVISKQNDILINKFRKDDKTKEEKSR